MILSSAAATAGPLAQTATIWLGAAAVGQSPSGDASAPDRDQAADLLSRAQQAMAENRFDLAEALISKAEALGINYGIWYQGDTPRKARRDLDRKRNAALAEASKPSQLLTPMGLGGDKKAPANDPFAKYTADSSGSQQLTPLPNVDPTAAQLSSATRTPSTNRIRPPSRARTTLGPPASTHGRPAATPRRPIRVRCGSRGWPWPWATSGRAIRRGGQGHAPELSAVRRHAREGRGGIQKCQELLALDKSTEAYARAYARTMMVEADALARWGEFDQAEQLALRAARLNIAYSPFEQKPQELLDRIANLRRQNNSRAAGGGPPSLGGPAGRRVRPVLPWPRRTTIGKRSNAGPRAWSRPAEYAANGGPDRNATPAVYDPASDTTRNIPAANQAAGYGPDSWMAQNAGQPDGGRAATAQAGDGSGGGTPPGSASDGKPQTPGMAPFQRGEDALRARDGARAYDFFRQAANYPNDFDSVTWQRLQDHLQMLSASRANPPAGGQPAGVADQAAARQQLLARQVATELAQSESNALAVRERDPKRALGLWRMRRKVEAAGLEPPFRDQLLRRVDRAIDETRQLIEQNRPQIELAEKNNRIREQVGAKGGRGLKCKRNSPC